MATIVAIILLVVTVASVRSVQIMFEQFRGCSSNGVFECNLRVHKINRTVAALYGNASLLMDLTETFETSFNAFHSPMGNNQYNLYPMKISPVDFCVFMRNFWGDYYPYLEKSISNLAGPKECPISARQFQVNDLILDPEMLPPYVPTGLWKLIWQAKDGSTEKFLSMEVIFKVSKNGYM